MSESGGSEREPNGWELLRGIQRIESTITSISAGFVSAAVYDTLVESIRQDRAASTKAREDAAAALKEERILREAGDKRLETVAEDARKDRAKTWLAVALGALALFGTVFGPSIRQAIGLP